MTTFSPEAASSFLLLSVHITPPSICVHLPLLLNSRHPHHNRSVSYSLAFWTRRRHCFGVLLCFSLHFYLPWMPTWSFLFSSVLVLSLLYLLLLYLSLPLFCVGWLSFYNMLPLSTTQTSATEPPLLAISR